MRGMSVKYACATLVNNQQTAEFMISSSSSPSGIGT
jgi:hypothetical protein